MNTNDIILIAVAIALFIMALYFRIKSNRLESKYKI